MLRALEYEPSVYHMNEGHAALLTIPVLEQELHGAGLQTATERYLEAVRRRCVFTTHTPVPAGHDRFSGEQAYRILGAERAGLLERFGCFHDGLLAGRRESGRWGGIALTVSAGVVVTVAAGVSSYRTVHGLRDGAPASDLAGQRAARVGNQETQAGEIPEQLFRHHELDEAGDVVGPAAFADEHDLAGVGIGHQRDNGIEFRIDPRDRGEMGVEHLDGTDRLGRDH